MAALGTTGAGRSAALRPRGARIARYLTEMFPPFLLVPHGLASFFATYLGLQAQAGMAPQATPRAWVGATSFVLFMLLFRLYDELKDAESDRRMAAIGDPRYVDRPLVTGRIQLADVVLLRWIVTAVLFALNLPLGFPLPVAGFAVVFALTWASFHWYFRPEIAKNLLLAFVTHNPLTLVLHGYVACVFAADSGIEALRPGAVPLLVGMWLAVATWELSRKVRLPEMETEYQTYSMILGWKVAALLPGIVAVTSAALLVVAMRSAGIGWLPLAPLVIAALLLAARGVLLRVAPTPARTRLQPWAELYGAVASLNLLISLVARRA